jgi:hypothetical protein
MNKNVLTYLPSQSHEAEAPNKLLSIAVVTDMQNNIPVSVMLNELSYNVVGYLSLMPGIVPGMNLGDKVLISAVAEGVLIHGVVTDVDAPARANFGFVEGKLVIEAQGAVVLKSGNATVELTEAGAIRIDGKDVRTVAKKTLTLLGASVNLN